MDNQNPLRELIRVMLRQLGTIEKAGASCCGATIGQCQAIQEIGQLKQISLNDLAKQINLDKSTTSRTVNNLVNLGFVERITDSADRRFIEIKLTPKGSNIFNTIDNGLELYYQNILGDIPRDKQAQVIESLWLLVNAVKNNKCC